MVELKDPAYELKADSLLYNSETTAGYIHYKHFIRDSSGRTIVTREGFYDLKNHRAQFGKRPTITDKGETITADNIHFRRQYGSQYGNRKRGFFRDTAQGLTLISNYMLANKKTNSFLATQKPLIIFKRG
ncbi:MAG: hypothetical protein WDM78_06190 [Puia sp.]